MRRIIDKFRRACIAAMYCAHNLFLPIRWIQWIACWVPSMTIILHRCCSLKMCLTLYGALCCPHVCAAACVSLPLVQYKGGGGGVFWAAICMGGGWGPPHTRACLAPHKTRWQVCTPHFLCPPWACAFAAAVQQRRSSPLGGLKAQLAHTHPAAHGNLWHTSLDNMPQSRACIFAHAAHTICILQPGMLVAVALIVTVITCVIRLALPDSSCCCVRSCSALCSTSQRGSLSCPIDMLRRRRQ